MSQPSGPTLAGFSVFVYSIMQIDPLVLPTDSAIIGYAYQTALMIVDQSLQAAGCPPGSQWSIYAIAVYNLGGSNIVNYAQDVAGRTYFADMRKDLGISKFQPGVVAGSSDQGTATSLLNPDFMRGLTLANLQQIKDRWGRAYLQLAQDYGPGPWGIS
jgi:hypothetical protein